MTKQIPACARGKLEGERKSLVRLIELTSPQGSPKNKVTIVFDGLSDMAYAQEASSVKVVFSQGESGDEKIREIVQSTAHKKNMIVVSDDKELKFSVRALGAKVMSVKDFLAKIRIQSALPRMKPSQNKIKEERKYIAKSLEDQINKELAGIWLSSKSDQ
ncbi:MAG: NYN domain-containing protein [Candidatus Omnitrophota bacterium]